MTGWYWEIFLKNPTDADYTYLEWLFSAWGWTIAVSIFSLFLAIFCGTLIGILRTLPNNTVLNKLLIYFGTCWVELFRNIPLLVQIFLWFHVLPQLITPLKALSGFYLIIIALGLFTSARIAEIVRAGIQTRPTGQRYAAMAMGFTTYQTYRYVLMPSTLRVIMPPLTSEFMGVVKNSAVAFAVSVAELTMFATQAQEETARGIEIYLAVTGLYIISAIAVNLIMNLIESSLRIPGMNTSMGGK